MNVLWRKSFRLFLLMSVAALVSTQALAVPRKAPTNPKMDTNNDQNISRGERRKAQGVWNRNHEGCQAGECNGQKGQNGRFNNQQGGKCEPGDHACINQWKKNNRCEPNDKRCIEHHQNMNLNGPGSAGQGRPGYGGPRHPGQGYGQGQGQGQGQKPKCHPKDKKCQERMKKFQRSQVDTKREEAADYNNDGIVGGKERKEFKQDNRQENREERREDRIEDKNSGSAPTLVPQVPSGVTPVKPTAPTTL